jgi:predicted Zn-dependent peptidase
VRIGWCIALLCLVMGMAACATQEIPNPFPPHDLTTFTLGNGLRVTLREDHTLPIISMVVVVRGGSGCEANTRGMAHFLEHLTLQGTAKYPGALAPQFALETVGGMTNAVTNRDMTRYQASIASDKLELLADVLAQVTLHPTLEETPFQKEQPVILNEVQRDEDTPVTAILNMAYFLTYARHPYRYPVTGAIDEIMTLSPADVRAFHRRWYVPNNMSVTLVGDVTARRAQRVLEAAFGAVKSAPLPALPAAEPDNPAQRTQRLHVPRDLSTTFQVMAFAAPSATEPGKEVATDLLVTLLSDGGDALLASWWQQQGVPVKRYGVEYATSRDPGRVLIWAETVPAAALRVKESTQLLLRRLATSPLPEPAFTLARQRLLAQFLLDNETYSQQAATLAYYEGLGRGGHAGQYVPITRALTGERVQAVVPTRLLGWVTLGAAPEGER